MKKKPSKQAKPPKPPKTKQSPQDKLREKAQWVATRTKLPLGARIVVAITDARGDWLGVGSNTNPVDTARILQSALIGSPTRKRGDLVEVHTDGVEVITVERPRGRLVSVNE